MPLRAPLRAFVDRVAIFLIDLRQPRCRRFFIGAGALLRLRSVMLRIYTLSNCDTCRAATKWLREHRIAFEERAIRETPPSPTELRAALAANGNELRKLFNTSGRDYREGKLGEKLAAMSIPDALKLLTGNGNLVKRPFLVGDGVTLVGFNADTWSAALSKR
jgi:arsenate reductase